MANKPKRVCYNCENVWSAYNEEDCPKCSSNDVHIIPEEEETMAEVAPGSNPPSPISGWVTAFLTIIAVAWKAKIKLVIAFGIAIAIIFVIGVIFAALGSAAGIAAIGVFLLFVLYLFFENQGTDLLLKIGAVVLGITIVWAIVGIAGIHAALPWDKTTPTTSPAPVATTLPLCEKTVVNGKPLVYGDTVTNKAGSTFLCIRVVIDNDGNAKPQNGVYVDVGLNGRGKLFLVPTTKIGQPPKK